MDKDVLLTDLLGLCDQTLLKTLNLLYELISLWVGTLELAPAVHIKWLFKFVSEELCLLLLFKELLLKKEDLPTQIRDAGGLILGNDE